MLVREPVLQRRARRKHDGCTLICYSTATLGKEIGASRADPRPASPSLVLDQQLGRRSPALLLLEQDIGELLPGIILDDEAGLGPLRPSTSRETPLERKKSK